MPERPGKVESDFPVCLGGTRASGPRLFSGLCCGDCRTASGSGLGLLVLSGGAITTQGEKEIEADADCEEESGDASALRVAQNDHDRVNDVINRAG